MRYCRSRFLHAATALLLALSALSGPSSSSAATTYWTLKPAKHPSVDVGTYAVVGGKTAPEGVHFSLNDTSINAPVVITLASDDPKTPLTLKAFKDTPAQALFTGTTDASGVVVCKYRSGETMSFQVSGPAGAVYNLAAWVGPEIILPPPSPVVSMKSVNPTADADIPSTSSPRTSESTGTQAPSNTTERDPLIYFLLGGIFVALLVIAVLIFRGQQVKSKASIILLGFCLAALGSAQAQDGNLDLRPGNVDPGKENRKIAETVQTEIDEFKKRAEQLKELTGGKIDFNSPIDLSSLGERGLKNPNLNVAGILQTALNLLEAYEVIDPREKFIQPDYNPKGLPPLPSRGMDDIATMSPAVYGEFIGLQNRINQAKQHLEANYVVLKQTELKTKRLEELADTAGGFSAIAGLYWANIKADPNDPMNKSKAEFYKKYDGGQENGLKYLNDALKDFAEFELKQYGDRNWYLYFGLPYYNFMSARYTRPGA